MSTANHLTTNAWLKLRNEVAQQITYEGVEPATARAAAELLIEQNYIDVKEVLGLP